MARYKHIDTSRRFLAVDLRRQLLPGTVEHALDHLLDHEIDLSALDARFRNDETGATAYPPAMLLKVILFAYPQGIVGSRGIEAACREHVTFIALCGDSAPHFTTIASFVSTLGEDNFKELADRKIDALIADNGMRGRDERFADQDQHKAKPDPDPLWNKTPADKKEALFSPKDFTYDEEAKVCICPAGEFLYQNGARVVIDGREGVKFTGAKRVCGPCPVREKCLRHPERTAVRQAVFFTGKLHKPESHSARMKRSIDSPEGRMRYGQRFATVEPVFGNLRYNKGLDRFTLRGQTKVDGQWKLFCLVHNIEKLAHHGYAQ